MYKFTSLLALNAILEQVNAVNTHYMYDPLNMAQTSARASVGARSLLTAANQAMNEEKKDTSAVPTPASSAAAAGAIENKKVDKSTLIESLSPDPPKTEEKKPSADSIAAKREWCIS